MPQNLDRPIYPIFGNRSVVDCLAKEGPGNIVDTAISQASMCFAGMLVWKVMLLTGRLVNAFYPSYCPAAPMQRLSEWRPPVVRVLERVNQCLKMIRTTTCHWAFECVEIRAGQNYLLASNRETYVAYLICSILGHVLALLWHSRGLRFRDPGFFGFPGNPNIRTFGIVKC